jgi:hypothetical protein
MNCHFDYEDEEGKKYYRTIDKNYAKNVVAFCHFHKGYMTVKQLKLHKCISKKCRRLQKTDYQYWEDRRAKKELKKLKKHDYTLNIRT